MKTSDDGPRSRVLVDPPDQRLSRRVALLFCVSKPMPGCMLGLDGEGTWGEWGRAVIMLTGKISEVLRDKRGYIG